MKSDKALRSLVELIVTIFIKILTRCYEDTIKILLKYYEDTTKILAKLCPSTIFRVRHSESCLEISIIFLAENSLRDFIVLTGNLCFIIRKAITKLF